MTEEQTRSLIAAYRLEREGYVKRGLAERVALVDAELARLGWFPPTHQSGATRRPRGAGRETR